ncbi:MAG TPA: Hsp20/alpha crystallin family protein, partial [Thermodesulfobacteriota bacterium]|nr:Hsp20/alpha crystallin family protein [Thermodesulfobacteriota bacterium]
MASLMKWTPEREMTRFFDSAFEDVLADMERFVGKAGRGKDLWPRLETFEKNGAYVVKADLPGMEGKDIEVTLENGFLVIRGERKTEKEINRREVKGREVFYGSFRRAVPVPEGLKTEDLKARYRNGVLEISAPLTKALPAAKV